MIEDDSGTGVLFFNLIRISLRMYLYAELHRQDKNEFLRLVTVLHVLKKTVFNENNFYSTFNILK